MWWRLDHRKFMVRLEWGYSNGYILDTRWFLLVLFVSFCFLFTTYCLLSLSSIATMLFSVCPLYVSLIRGWPIKNLLNWTELKTLTCKHQKMHGGFLTDFAMLHLCHVVAFMPIFALNNLPNIFLIFKICV